MEKCKERKNEREREMSGEVTSSSASTLEKRGRYKDGKNSREGKGESA